MAKKFFYNKVYNPKRERIIIISIFVAVFLLIALIVFFVIRGLSGKVYTCSNHIIKKKDVVSIDLNSSYPDKKDYFSELQCVNEKRIKVDTKNIDISKLGEYTAKITIGKETFETKVKVVDKSAPVVVTKPVTIKYGTTYSYTDFIQSCSDNSKEDCQIEFYKGDKDNYGSTIDYSSFFAIGKYKVKIAAKDSAGNQSVVTTTLEIVDATSSADSGEIIACSNGNINYDAKYIPALLLDNKCALSESEIKKEEDKQISSILNSESEKIQQEVSSINGLTKDLQLNRKVQAIPNTEGNGFVGFSLFIEVVDSNKQVIVSYYLRQDGTRAYQTNFYNLK